MTSRKDDEDIYEFEWDWLKDVQRVYQGRLCELGVNIFELLKVDKTKNPFFDRTVIQYIDAVDQYMVMAAEFLEGYFREDRKISNLYVEKKYKPIVKLVLENSFGMIFNFRENWMESPFRVIKHKQNIQMGQLISKGDRFYPKVWEFHAINTTYEPDTDVCKILSRDDWYED